jgi:hypothetical protein
MRDILKDIRLICAFLRLTFCFKENYDSSLNPSIIEQTYSRSASQFHRKLAMKYNIQTIW